MKRYPRLKRFFRRWTFVPLLLMLGGAAYAILTSPSNTLTGNTIQTTSANLTLSKDGINFGTTFPGFDFTNILPGAGPTPASGYPIYLKNTGATPLAIKLSMTKTPTNPGNVDLSKVNLNVTIVGISSTQNFTLSSLLAADSSGVSLGSVNLAVDATQQYKLQVAMATDAIATNSALISGIDLIFTGVASS